MDTNRGRLLDGDSQRTVREANNEVLKLRLKQAHAAGLTDYQISERIGITSRRVAELRAELGLPKNQRTDW